MENIKHQRHLIDGDQLSSVTLQRLIGNIGYKDNVGITIFHNSHFGKYNDKFCRQCHTTGISMIQSPDVKNGADFLLISHLTEILCKKYNSEIYIHTNDKALMVTAKAICNRYFINVNCLPIKIAN